MMTSLPELAKEIRTELLADVRPDEIREMMARLAELTKEIRADLHAAMEAELHAALGRAQRAGTAARER